VKLIKKIGIISILSTLSLPLFAKDFSFDCLENDKIDYNIDFLDKSSSLIDTENFSNDFKSGIDCYRPATFVDMTFVKSSYNINDQKFFYENVVNFGEQVFFLNGKIPKNSFLFGHPSIPILLYKSNYLDVNDISDYYLSFEKTYSENKSIDEPLKVLYNSPYNFTTAMIHTSTNNDSKNVLFYFNTSDNSDIMPLKESIETYFLNIIKKNKLPLKLQSTEEIEIMRVYMKGFYNSLNLLEPFLEIFLDHIDENNMGFKSDLKHSEVDEVFSSYKSENPFALFGEHIVISYTFDKISNSGLIAFSFIEGEEAIKQIQENYTVID
jgi:hypothetical protein